MVWKWLTLAAVATSLMLAIASAQAERVVLIEYGLAGCPHCKEQLEILRGLGVEFIYVELQDNETNVEEYLSIYDSVVGGEHYVPLIIVAFNTTPKAVVVGGGDAKYWENLIERVEGINGILVVGVEGGERVLEDEELISMLEHVIEARLKGRVSPSRKPRESLTISQAIPIMLSTALADSVNPCTFSVFTALLLITLSLSGRREALLASIAFIVAVYACYYALGVGLVTAIATLPSIFTKIVAIAGLAVGAYSVTSSIKGGFRSPLPSRLKRITEERVSRAVSPLGAAAAGVVCSFTLLPCSSGPYLVFTAVLSRLSEEYAKYLLLALYNIIFVLPLAGIAMAVTLLGLAARRVKAWRTKGLATMELVSGVLLIAVCTYIMLFY